MLTFLRKIRKSLIEIGSVRKYLLYSIGEIVLVVIGIMIALMLNNWNERRKENNQLHQYIPLLIEGLRKDSISIRRNLQEIEVNENELKEFKSRLTSDFATIDTLIKIAKEEFSPHISVDYISNDQVYQNLIMTGEISLFENQLSQRIHDYYTSLAKLNRTDDNSWGNYLSSIQAITSKYTLQTSFIDAGPIHEKIWEAPDVKELGPKFSFWAGSKKLFYNQMKNGIELIEDKNKALLEELRGM